MTRSIFHSIFTQLSRLNRFQKKESPPAIRWLRALPLRLERLEDRIQPTTDIFTNPLGGSWSTGSNWSLNAPPTSSEDAQVSIGGTGNVTYTSGTNTIQNLVSDGSLDVSGGTLNAQGNISGTVQVSGSGVLDLSGAALTQQGNVTLNIASGATANLSGNLNNTGQTLTVTGMGTLNLTGTLRGYPESGLALSYCITS